MQPLTFWFEFASTNSYPAATRIVTAFPDAAWTGAFIRAVYTANFADDADISDAGVIDSLLRELDLDPMPLPLLDAASSPETKAALRGDRGRHVPARLRNSLQDRRSGAVLGQRPPLCRHRPRCDSTVDRAAPLCQCSPAGGPTCASSSSSSTIPENA